MKELLNKLQTGILLLLAAGAPVVAVLDEQYWFEKRVALAASAVVLLAVWAAWTWKRGSIGHIGHITGWGLLAASLVAGAIVPAGRMANLLTPELWVGIGAVLAYFAIRSTTTSSRMVKLGFFGVLGGLVVAAALCAAGIGRIGPMGPIREQATGTLQLLQHSPIFGEFREFRVARVGALQVASGLGILGILGTLALVYQLGLKSVKGIIKPGSLWWRLLNILVLILLTGFLVLPHPALTLFPLAIVAALAGGMARISPIGPIRRGFWAIFVGTLVVVIAGSSFGLGKVVWGELKFREALAAANRNEGITTYYALLESIQRNPYEVRYRLLASQIDIALANSIAVAAGEEMTTQDQNNILILIQQAVVEGKAAIKLDPKNALLWQNLAAIYRSLIGVAGGAEDWALKSYQRAAELNPSDPNPQLFVGEIHFLAGNFQGAVDSFKEAVRVDPNFARAHYDLAVAYNALNEIDKAFEELRETLALLPTDDPGREQVEKDLEFLRGEAGSLKLEKEATESAELREATSSAEVEPPPPPVGPEEATESAKIENEELRIKNEEGL